MLQFKLQPKGFSIFFLVEMWERYGFYVIQTILIFFLLHKLGYNDAQAYSTVGSFTALSYINSLFGGFIADKFLGYYLAIIYGAILLISGYFLFAFSENVFYVNLSITCIAVGAGLLKPNISTMLNTIYLKNNNSLKEAGYTLYYVGIYVGATCGAFLGGYLNKIYSYQISFISASISISIAIVIFLIGVKINKLTKSLSQHSRLGNVSGVVAICFMFFIAFKILNSEYYANILFSIIAIFCFTFLAFLIFKSKDQQRSNFIVFFILILKAIVYWSIFYQMFLSLGLCIERLTSNILPASIFSAFESISVIGLGLFINYIWYYLRNSNPVNRILIKYSLGFLANAIGFLVIIIGLKLALHLNTKINIIFMIIAYIIIGFGEVCLSPTSLSMVTMLVPQRYMSIMMGISLLSIGFGGKVAGFIANLYPIDNSVSTLDYLKKIYIHSFCVYFIISIFMFLLSIFLIKYINKFLTSNKDFK